VKRTAEEESAPRVSQEGKEKEEEEDKKSKESNDYSSSIQQALNPCREE